MNLHGWMGCCLRVVCMFFLALPEIFFLIPCELQVRLQHVPQYTDDDCLNRVAQRCSSVFRVNVTSSFWFFPLQNLIRWSNFARRASRVTALRLDGRGFLWKNLKKKDMFACRWHKDPPLPFHVSLHYIPVCSAVQWKVPESVEQMPLSPHVHEAKRVFSVVFQATVDPPLTDPPLSLSSVWESFFDGSWKLEAPPLISVRTG